MLKGIATENGREVVLIGLSRQNLEKLLAEMLNTFVRVDGIEMNLPFDILIFSGETERAMANAIHQPLTKIYQTLNRD